MTAPLQQIDTRVNDELRALVIDVRNDRLFWGGVFAAFLATFEYPYASHRALALWIGCKVAIVFVRAVEGRMYVRQGLRVETWWIGQTLSTIDGLIWGALLLTLNGTMAPQAGPLAACAFSCVIAMASNSHRSDWKSFVMYTVPMAAMLALYLLGTGIVAFRVAALAVVIFETTMIIKVVQSNRQVRNFFEIRFKSETLSKERERALNLAEERARVKSQFMAAMTHELRTPLQGILGLSDLARAETSPDGVGKRLDLLEKAGHSLLTVIDDILDFSQLESGQVALKAQRFDMYDLIVDVLSLAQATAQSKQVSLESQIDVPKPCWVKTDPMRVRQVLLQLLGNAFKFTHQGTVRLSVARLTSDQGERYIFRVRDTGIGIHEQALAHVFEPFHQADARYSRKYSGVGIGLTRALQIASALGGALTCKSQLGVGSEFCFEFEVQPMAMAEDDPGGAGLAPAPCAAPAKPAGGDLLKQRRILLAEDNAINALVMQEQLELLDMLVTVVTDGRAAVEVACAAQRPDLALMDCQMPGLDGFEATRQIRQHELVSGLRPMPIIAVTALAADEHLDLCLASGMNERLVKPVSIKSLERALRKALQDIAAQT